MTTESDAHVSCNYTQRLETCKSSNAASLDPITIDLGCIINNTILCDDDDRVDSQVNKGNCENVSVQCLHEQNQANELQKLEAVTSDHSYALHPSIFNYVRNIHNEDLKTGKMNDSRSMYIPTVDVLKRNNVTHCYNEPDKAITANSILMPVCQHSSNTDQTHLEEIPTANSSSETTALPNTDPQNKRAPVLDGISMVLSAAAFAENSVSTLYLSNSKCNTLSLSTAEQLPQNRPKVFPALEWCSYVTNNCKKRWVCKMCDKSYTVKHNLVTHILGHSGIKKYQCKICRRSFKQLSHLQSHTLTHNHNNIKPFRCDTCNKGFTQISHLKRHKLLIHTTHTQRPYICEQCCKGFVFQSELKQHFEKVHVAGKKNWCLLCKREFATEKQISQHMKKHSSKHLQCMECSKTYMYPSQLKEHMLSHSNTLKYTCKVCNAEFRHQCYLHNHMHIHKPKCHTCDVCGREFALKSNMTRHRKTHLHSRHLRCDYCGKQFKQQQTLNSHLVIHQKSKPFTCSQCGKGFNRKFNYEAHLSVHTHNKKFQCPCGTTFTLKSNLVRHTRTHRCANRRKNSNG